MKQFFILLICLFSFRAFAQQDSLAEKDSTALRYRLCVKTAPLAFLDIYNGGSLVIIAESFPMKQFSIAPEFGMYFGIPGYNSKNNKGIRAGMELRYYYSQSEKEDQFVGLRYFHRKQTFTATDTVGIGTEPVYLKSFQLAKEVNVIDFTWGARRYLKKKNCFYEFFIGAGVRMVDAEASGITQTEIDNRLFGESMVLPMVHYCGYHAMPDFILGWKFGFGVK